MHSHSHDLAMHLSASPWRTLAAEHGAPGLLRDKAAGLTDSTRRA